MHSQEKIDESLKESFPASDPSSWTVLSGVGRHQFDDRKEPYNYDHFSTDKYNLLNFRTVQPGEPLPDLDLFTLQGERVRLSDYHGQKIVLETSSITCPLFISKIDKMNDLNEMFDDTRFIVIYTREAHPGDRFQHHQSISQKLQHARFLRSRYGEKRDILVDHTEGYAHQIWVKCQMLVL